MPTSYLSRFLASSHPATPEKWLIDWFRGPLSASGIYVDAGTAERFAAVFSGIRLLAESLAGLPLHLYRSTGTANNAVKATDHPLYRLLHFQPNPYQTAFEYWEMSMGHLVSRGMLTSEKFYNGYGEIAALIPLNPARLQVIFPSELDGNWTYEYRPQRGEPRRIAPDRLFRVLAFSLDGKTGRSMFEVAREPVALGLAAEKYGAEFYANDASPGGVLKHPTRLTQDAYDRIKRDWNADHSGDGQRHRFAILEEGLEWAQLGIKMTDAQFIESRKFQVVEIARLMRIPPHKLMDLDRATFSNIEHQGLEFVTDSLLPWCRRIEQAIWRDLLDPIEQLEYFGKFNLDGLLRGDLQSRYTAYAIGRQWGWLNPNEIRDKEDMPARDDAGGDEYLSPLNMVPDSQLAPSPSQRTTDKPQGQVPAPQPAGFLAPARERAADDGDREFLAALLQDGVRRACHRQAEVMLAVAKRPAAERWEALSLKLQDQPAYLERAVLPVALPALTRLAAEVGARPPAAGEVSTLILAFGREAVVTTLGALAKQDPDAIGELGAGLEREAYHRSGAEQLAAALCKVFLPAEAGAAA